MKTIKAWAIVNRKNYISKLSETCCLLMIYPVKSEANRRKMSNEKVIRVEIRELKGKKS